MTPEFKALTLKRLMDGTYTREFGQLVKTDVEGNPVKAPNGAELRCCLGVMRQVAVELNMLPAEPISDIAGKANQTLTDDEREVIGLAHGDMMELIDANDDHSTHFSAGEFYPSRVIEIVTNLH